MRIIALDLSKRSAGYACWGLGDDDALSGAWELGSEFTSDGEVFANLHGRLSEIHEQREIDAIFVEEALDPRILSGHTNIASLKVLSGLIAHAKSWGAAMGCRFVREVNQAKWRREFLGPTPRGTKRIDLKEMAMERARYYGFKPKKHDEAEAIGLLTYGCLSVQITPIWIRDEIFRPDLRRAR